MGEDGASDVFSGAVVIVRGVTFFVRMHPSRTSAVARFADKTQEHSISLVAARGGGAATTAIPKGYVAAVRALGVTLWPKSTSSPRKPLAR